MDYQPAELFTQPLSHASWKQIPCSFIFTEQDEIIPVKDQRRMVEDAKSKHGVSIETFSLSSSHSPFLSMPEKLVKIVNLINMNTEGSIVYETAPAF